MKLYKILMVFILILIFTPQVFSIEEVILDTDGDLLYKKPAEKTKYLLEEVLTKNFDKSIVESVHLFGIYRGDFSFDFNPSGESGDYDFTELSAGINGKFRDGKTYYEARLRFSPQDNYSFLQFMPSNIYIANTAIPHHTIILGNTRTPTGYEGVQSIAQIPFVARSQIARNFGNVRKVGLRVKGNYDFIDYDIGGYSSDTYFRKFFPGMEFAGWANIKPLAFTDGRWGSLKLGGGITAGQNEIDYFVSGAYAGYEYKNLSLDFEYARANGYNGYFAISADEAEGFYTTLGYKVTPKLQCLMRYDQYTPNLAYSDDIRREYSFGVNYFIKEQALKLMLNYVYCQNDLFDDSHRVILGTQILL